MPTNASRFFCLSRRLLVLGILAGPISNVLAETIPLENDHGTFVVPVIVNNQITLKFTVDSGASDVVIPSDVFSTLIRTGTISAADIRGSAEYQIADGSTSVSRRVRLRSLRVGGIEIRDVIASVAPQSGLLLLGQSFLSRFSSWSIDNGKHVLVLSSSSAEEISATPASSSAPARDPKYSSPKWVDSGSYSDGKGTLYIDTSSIRTDGAIRLAWWKVEYSTHTQHGVVDPNKWLKLVALRQAVDCDREVIRVEEATFYYEDGTADNPPPGSLPGRWDTVSPIGASHEMMSAVCQNSARSDGR